MCRRLEGRRRRSGMAGRCCYHQRTIRTRTPRRRNLPGDRSRTPAANIGRPEQPPKSGNAPDKRHRRRRHTPLLPQDDCCRRRECRCTVSDRLPGDTLRGMRTGRQGYPCRMSRPHREVRSRRGWERRRCNSDYKTCSGWPCDSSRCPGRRIVRYRSCDHRRRRGRRSYTAPAER